MIIGWFFFFYLVLTLPVLAVSWYFSEPFSMLLSQHVALMGLCLLALVFMLQRYFRQWLFGIESNQYVIMVMLWFGAAILGAGVFKLYPVDMSWEDAFFASVSGLTTTGLDVFSSLTRLPKSMLFLRMWLQFIGGLGIILMAMTALTTGGFSVGRGVKCDLPGPVVSYSRKRPKMTDIARYLWLIYCIAALVCCVSLRTLGLSWYESVCESFSIVSTGGYTLYDAGLSHYQSSGVKIIAILFMFFSGINYLLHYQFFVLREYLGYRSNIEFRSYLVILLSMGGLFTSVIWLFGSGVLMLDVIFMVVSMVSSAGFVVSDIQNWPSFLPPLLIFLGLVGGCAGSTSGGIKIIRWQFLVKEGARACQLMRHPRAILPDPAAAVGMLGSSADYQITIMRGFFSIYIGYFFFSILVLSGLGLDFSSAFFAVCASLSNTGVMLASPASAAGLSGAVKSWLALTMLIGRIEILAFFVILSPSYLMER